MSIWFFLTMEYHREPSVGHTTAMRSRDCGECRLIAALATKWARSKGWSA